MVGHQPAGELSRTMPLRSFMDEEGVEWTVWDVHPALPDRRSGADRRASAAPDPVIERRRESTDRRRRVGSRWSGLPTALLSGWLVFSAGSSQQRRLMPIPDRWESVDERELKQLCERAVPVVRRGA